MASNGSFSVRITAIDAATKQIDAINKRLAAMRAPAERMNKAMSRFTKLSGLNNVGKAFGKLKNGAMGIAKAVGGIIAPLGVMTGAASLAGMAALAAHAGDLANNLTIVATRMGVSTGKLAQMQAMGRLIGGTGQGYAQSVANLGSLAQDALAGRNQRFMQLAASMHINLRDHGMVAKSGDQLMRQFWQKIYEMRKNGASAATMRYTQSQLGMDDATFAAAEKGGGAGYDKAMARARLYAGPASMLTKAAKAATQFNQAQRDLNESLQGFGSMLEAQIFPVLTPIVKQMTAWVMANRNWLATQITNYLQEFVGWCKQTWPQVKSGLKIINGIAQAFGGWKAVLIGLAAIELGSWATRMVTSLNPLTLALAAIAETLYKIDTFGDKGHGGDPSTWNAQSPFWQGISKQEQLKYKNSPASQAQLKSQGKNTSSGSWLRDKISHAWDSVTGGGGPSITSAQKNANIAMARKYFMSQGWSAAQTAGILANMNAESGFNSGAVGDNGAAYGLGQWHADRRAAFKKLFGHGMKKGTFGEQLQFEQWELTHTESRAGNALKKARNAYNAAETVSLDYERPAGGVITAMNRANTANSFLGGPAIGPSGPPVKLAAANSHTIKGSADVNINLGGFPQGTTSTSSTSGDLFSAPRIAHAMPSVAMA